jgi:hypothetical protein
MVKNTCKKQLFNDKFSQRDMRIMKRNIKKESLNNISNKYLINHLENQIDVYKQYSHDVYNHNNYLYECYCDILFKYNNLVNSISYNNNNNNTVNYIEPQDENDIYTNDKAYDNLSNRF